MQFHVYLQPLEVYNVFNKMSSDKNEQELLPHHVQQSLCTTRLPYRQGRKLTAVKVYTINNESNHLLIFGVPSLNLRQETKAVFAKFGNLIQFNITKHTSELFTETYHAIYEKIQSARVAKRMMDTKNYYGGVLHVCYAPEYETIDETENKLMQRQRDVVFRLNKLKKDAMKIPEKIAEEKKIEKECVKINMGYVNIINVGDNRKRKVQSKNVIEKRFKPCFIDKNDLNITEVDESAANKTAEDNINENDTEIDMIDCTSVHKETITNVNELLNYNNFGNEDVRRVKEKPMNRVIFNFNNKKT